MVRHGAPARHLVERLHWRGSAHPERSAFSFESDAGAETVWTYAELDTHARAVAVQLLSAARPGDRILLLCPAGPEFAAAFLGALYAGLVPVPAYPPASAKHVGRVEVILRDADTDLIATTRRTRERIEKWLRDGSPTRAFRFTCVDEVEAASADAWRMPDLGPDSLAFLQYTSGSTSEPKGVMVSHGNLLANVGMLEGTMRYGPDMSMVSWLPMYHDMGLIGNVLGPLAVGGRTALMSPHAFVRSPGRWLQLITRHRATMTGAPNFAYALAVKHATDALKAELDLSTLTVCYCGSEPIQAPVMQAFVDTFRPCGLQPGAFYACYGMAETTLLSTGNVVGGGTPVLRVDADALTRGVAVPSEAPTARAVVGCGYSTDGQELRIVDPETRLPVDDGHVGEIWVRGPHVTQGYWRRPELTAEIFEATLANGDGPFLRTGDLAFLHEANVYVAGRRKDLIIVRGRNYHPQDIEAAAAASSPALNPAAAAFSVARDGEAERVVVVCEVTRQASRAIDGPEVAERIREAVLSEVEVGVGAIVLIRPATLPRTSSGKIRRAATRDAYLSGALDVVFTWLAPDEVPADVGSAARADAVIAWLRDYAGRRIDSRLMDERRTIPPYIVLDFGNHGLLGLQAPIEVGGLALTNRDLCRVLAQLAAIDLTLASFVGVHNSLGLRPLLSYGSAAQLDRLLPAVASGRELASFAFTEPAAGSNPTAIEATARPDGHGGWFLRGSKKWIGTAAWSSLIHVFAHVIDEHGVRRGITAFAVRHDAPGLVQGAEELTMGMRGMVQNTVHLNDVRVAPADVIGGIGQGMRIAQDIMEFGRVCIAGTAIGVMMRAGQLMARYASRRGVATGWLIDNFVSRERLTQLTLEAAALETLVDQFAGWLDAGVEVPKECYAAVKVLAAETSYRAVDRLMQMLGGRGYIESNLVPQMLRDTRLLRIFEGPTETMQMFVGTRVAAGSPDFIAFLRRLGGERVADTLVALADELNGRRGDGQRTAMLLGDAALWALWLAAVERAELKSEARWLHGCFERSVVAARTAPAEVLDRAAIEASIAGFADRIGDVDQHRPGVLESMDALLHRDLAAVASMPSHRVPEAPPVATALPAAAPTPSTTDAGGSTGTLPELERWMQQWIGRRLQQESSAISSAKAFADLGLDSLTAVELTADLEDQFGIGVPPTATWDYPNIRALAAHLACLQPATPVPSDTRPAAPAELAAPTQRVGPIRPPRATAPLPAVTAAMPEDHRDAIAVVGLACRFPGGATDADRFWTLLRNGVDVVGPVPRDRWDTDELYDPDPDAPGKLYMRDGAFLDDIGHFDAAFFGISPLEASTMDPQQRMLLEVAWEAFENAAIAPETLRGTRTGVFVGLMYQDYLSRQLRERGRDGIGPYLGTGSTFSAAAGRLSYVFGFQGPSLTVDTACSSSLVSVHLACQALRSGECETAIAGGANAIVSPEAAINLSKARMLSPTGRCRTFDASADGYTRGEGCGLIVLKRLSTARKDGDRILGIIRGSAVNQDGQSNGLTAPNGSAQRALIRQALASAGVHPGDVSYVECHGTGTPLGDPIEVDSLLAVYGERASESPLALGSVKTNFGHLESAAGICGVIKALLVLQHREIPPHLHLRQLNPRIDLAGRPVVIPTQRTEWFTQPGPRLAAVSAFGFVGTNAHVIIEGVDVPTPTPLLADDRPQILTLSAASAPALEALAERMASVLATGPNLEDVCYTTQVGRSHLVHRLAVVADTPRAMHDVLTSGRGLRGVAPSGQRPRVAALFTGQGIRAAVDGRRMYEQAPIFRQALDRYDVRLRSHLGVSLVSLLFDDAAPWDRTIYAQPALAALGHALFVQWRSWGVEPSVLVGHSVGEVTAAWAAGILHEDDALRLIAARARLMQALPVGGGMAAFMAPESWALNAIAGHRDSLSIAAVNGPSEVVVSGMQADLRRVVEAARADGIHVVELPVSHAFHSPLMRPILAEFRTELASIRFGRPLLPVISSMTGRMVGQDMSTPDYWLDHVMSPVRFGDAIEAVHAMGNHVHLEFGPQPVLGPLVSRLYPEVVTAHALSGPAALATLYVSGAPIAWDAVHESGARRRVALPTYPFQRERHWLTPSSPAAPERRTAGALLGELLPQAAHDPRTLTWHADVSRPFLRDHELLGVPVWPVAAQVDLAISAAREGLGWDRCQVTSMTFERTLYGTADAVQTVLTLDGDVRIYSRQKPGDDWVMNTRARVAATTDAAGAPLAFSLMFFAAKEEEEAARYRLILEASRYGDRAGFQSVWVPERHFTDMGSLYPNPSVLHAALARETSRIRLMAGSVVLPLHKPMRVAEEWAMVDNLSGGRVGVSLASGWNPHDFALAPEAYTDRQQRLYDGVDTLRRLWRGERIDMASPGGGQVALRTYPTPVQRDLPVWLTAARSVESFRKAGALGANLLTHLLDQDVEALAAKIAVYRSARAEHGFDPGAGLVTVMCHTFVAADMETAHRAARKPFCDYLKASKPLLQGLAQARKQDVDLDSLSDQEMDAFVSFLYERFHTTRALIGTPESCRVLVDRLSDAGVNEIACLLDFGPTTDEVLAHLPLLDQLRRGPSQPARIPPPVDVAAMQTRCSRIVKGDAFYEALSSSGVVFDRQLRTLGEVHAGTGEALAAIRPTEEPAIAIDVALQAAFAAFGTSRADGSMLVPAGIEMVRVHAPVSESRWAAVRQSSGTTFDITLVDADGRPIVEIDGFRVKVVARPSEALNVSKWLYEVRWRELEPAAAADSQRPWIVLEDRGGLAAQWAKRHRAPHLFLRRGAITEAVGPRRWTVNADDGFHAVFAQVDLGSYAGILDCWPLDQAADVATSQRHGVEAGVAIIQALGRAESRRVPRLWVVTREAQSVRGESPSGVSQSPLWGFASAVAREHPEWWGGIVDIDAAATAADLEQAVGGASPEDQVAIRGGRRYGRRIARASLAELKPLAFAPEATYVVAGGQGGLGLAIAQWMAVGGARRLLLLGRRPADPAALDTIQAQVEYLQVDIGDEAQVAAALNGRDIRGIVHAAGEFHDEAILRLDRARLWQVLRARVAGAWALHRASAKSSLDFFVLCSSFSALMPPHGQAAYAAAAAYLDGLAHWRRANGMAGLSLNWGAWSGVGFAASETGHQAHARLEAMGLIRMTPEQGIIAFDAAMRANVPPQLAVMPMDLGRAADIELLAGGSGLLADLAAAAPAAPSRLAAMTTSERTAFLQEQLARVVGDVLQIGPGGFDVQASLTSLGLDSLIAIQIRNRIQKEIGVTIPLVNVLKGGSVVSLVDDVLTDVNVQEGPQQ